MKNFLAALVILVPTAAFASSDSAFLSSVGSARAQLKASFAQPLSVVASQNEEETFLRLLDDSDPAVRISALKGLKNYVGLNSRTRERVLRVLDAYGEAQEVKKQAIKTLSWAANDRDVYEKLHDLARRSSQPSALRSIAYKALAWQLGIQSSIRSDVLDAAKRESDPAVRLGAIWALYTVNGQSDVRDGLLDIAKRSSEDDETRVAALRSLYGMMGMTEVRELAIDYARSRSTPAAVRYSAIMMLSARFSSSETELLEDLARNDPDARAKSYAAQALAQDRATVCRFFHLPLRDIYGRPVTDPLDDE